MDKVKLSFEFLITMIFTLLLAACGGNGGGSAVTHRL
jgi:hypothetical protein